MRLEITEGEARKLLLLLYGEEPEEPEELENVTLQLLPALAPFRSVAEALKSF